MEQKRILWITAAVGVFLLVVIGAALILYSPAQTSDPVLASSALEDTTWVRLPAQPQGASTAVPATGEGVVTVTSQPMQEIPLGQSPLQQVPAGVSSIEKLNGLTVYTESAQVYSTGTTTIDLNALKVQETPVAAVKAENAVAREAVASGKTAAPSVAASTATAPTAAVKPAQTASAPKPVATPVSIKKTTPLPDQFWVQAASYSSRKNADTAREALSANKIPCEVFTYTDSKGKVFYRVRVGPYATKSEAEYWQSRIALIEEFKMTQSYVTNATAKAN
jgi:cell division septation protein DedD